jgi:hypothetical protein
MDDSCEYACASSSAEMMSLDQPALLLRIPTCDSLESVSSKSGSFPTIPLTPPRQYSPSTVMLKKLDEQHSFRPRSPVDQEKYLEFVPRKFVLQRHLKNNDQEVLQREVFMDDEEAHLDNEILVKESFVSSISAKEFTHIH